MHERDRMMASGGEAWGKEGGRQPGRTGGSHPRRGANGGDAASWRPTVREGGRGRRPAAARGVRDGAGEGCGRLASTQ